MINHSKKCLRWAPLNKTLTGQRVVFSWKKKVTVARKNIKETIGKRVEIWITSRSLSSKRIHFNFLSDFGLEPSILLHSRLGNSGPQWCLWRTYPKIPSNSLSTLKIRLHRNLSTTQLIVPDAFRSQNIATTVESQKCTLSLYIVSKYKLPRVLTSSMSVK